MQSFWTHRVPRCILGLFFSFILIFSLTVSFDGSVLLLRAAAAETKTTEDVTTPEDSTVSSDSYQWKDDLTLAAEASIVMEASTGAILYQKNPDEILYPASITKIMTALLALEHCSLDEVVTFSPEAISNTEGSSAGIKPGEELTMKDCLYALMLASANEVAYAIAEHVGGTLEEFVAMMNERAEALGCTNTHFANPHGLFDEDHYTTAHDIALFSREALKNPQFCQITSTVSYTIPKTNLTKEKRVVNNHQEMLTGAKFPRYKYEGCIGGKTGYTEKAGYTLATFAKRNGMTLIGVVLRSGSPYEDANEYSDTIQMLDYCFNHFSITSLAQNQGLSSTAGDYNFFGKFSPLSDLTTGALQVEGGGQVILPNGIEEDQLHQELIPLDTPVPQSDGCLLIGQVVYSLAGRTLGQAKVTFQPSLSDSPLSSSISQNISLKEHSPGTASFTFSLGKFLLVLILIVLVVGILGVFLYYKHVVIPKRKKLSYRAEHFAGRKNRAQRSHERRNRNPYDRL